LQRNEEQEYSVGDENYGGWKESSGEF